MGLSGTDSRKLRRVAAAIKRSPSLTSVYRPEAVGCAGRPDDPGSWEARWFDEGDLAFPAFRAGALSFGLNICTELWALETYGDYAGKVQVVLVPRATGAATRAKWLAAGVVAAVRSGAYSVSSNRVDQTGGSGGASWVISPEGEVLATSTPAAPFATVDVDLAAWEKARADYPRYVSTRERWRQVPPPAATSARGGRA